MATAWDMHRETLRTALACQFSPCSYGPFPVAPENLVLFYGKDGPAKRLNLLGASEAQLKDLANACDAATFGRNQEDVLDETYRKAGKLDNTQFSINLEPHSIGLMSSIRDLLLEGHDEGTSIRCELYKLNVYGPGSFFKSHKDTPRGDDMFASLVVVLPTQHEGGDLVFRMKDKEFKFDSAAAVSTRQRAPKIAFAAFFSDVDHEVNVVRSGYRVTITWNLYFVKAEPKQDAPITTSFESGLKDALRVLMADPAYLPDGGYLGFGLQHEYPLDTSSQSFSRKMFKPLDHLIDALKGSDAVLYKVCKSLGVKTTLQMVYHENDFGDEADVLCPGSAKLGPYEWEDPIWRTMCESGAKRLETDIKVEWITEMRPVHLKKIPTQYVAYGNQAQLDTIYSTLVLIVELGPHDKRSGRPRRQTKARSQK